MARKCPDCKSDMESDGVHAWCPNADCAFEGYVVVRTGKIVPKDDQRGRYEPDGSRRGLGLKR